MAETLQFQQGMSVKASSTPRRRKFSSLWPKRFFLGLGVWFVLGLATAPGPQAKPIRESIKSKIEELDVDGDLKHEQQFGSYFNAIGSVGGGIRPGFQKDQFIREERYKLRGSFNLGYFLSQMTGSHLPLNLTLEKGREIKFYREFKTQKEAIFSMPLNPMHIPVTTKGLEHFPDGTIISLPARTRVTLGAGIGRELFRYIGLGYAEASLGASVFMEGSFDFIIQKISKDKVRLRILAKKERGINFGFYSGGRPIFFQQYFYPKLTRKIDKFFSYRFLDVDFYRQSEGVFGLSDYTYDLTQPGTREAYNSALGGYRSFREERILAMVGSKNQGNRNIQRAFGPDLRLSEAMVEAEQRKPVSQRAVLRHFSGSNTYKRNGDRIESNLVFWRMSRARDVSINRIQYTVERPGPDVQKEVVLANQVTQKSHSLFKGFGRESERRETYELANVDSRGRVALDGTQEIGYNFEFLDKRLGDKDLNDIERTLKKALGLELFSLVYPELKRIRDISQKPVKNVTLRLRARLSPALMDTIEQTLPRFNSQSDRLRYLENALREYIGRVEKEGHAKLSRGLLGIFGKTFDGARIRSLAARLEQALWPARHSGDGNVKIRRFIELSGDRIFNQVSIGFLTDLAKRFNPRMDLRKYVFLEWEQGLGKERPKSLVLSRGPGGGRHDQFQKVLRHLDESILPENMFKDEEHNSGRSLAAIAQ